jgi:ABC-type polysaccharide/polyol phosphate export permease
MFYVKSRQTKIGSAFAILALIYHCTVQAIRSTNRNAFLALLTAIMQTLILITAFYFMMSMLGMRRIAIRGDFIVYIMSGIFLYMTHIKTVSAVARSGGPTSAMMNHAPMNTIVAIAAAALSTLYLQLLTVFVVLYGYHVVVEPVHIDDPIGAIGMILVAWFSGVGVGMVLLAITPWSPGFANVATLIYTRANMIASGKMFVANSLPATKVAIFDWNPLFHIIDQTRGYAFINYNPHVTSLHYPIYVGLVLIMIGLMAEFYTRRHASLSWNATR